MTPVCTSLLPFVCTPSFVTHVEASETTEVASALLEIYDKSPTVKPMSLRWNEVEWPWKKGKYHEGFLKCIETEISQRIGTGKESYVVIGCPLVKFGESAEKFHLQTLMSRIHEENEDEKEEKPRESNSTSAYATFTTSTYTTSQKSPKRHEPIFASVMLTDGYGTVVADALSNSDQDLYEKAVESTEKKHVAAFFQRLEAKTRLFTSMTSEERPKKPMKAGRIVAGPANRLILADVGSSDDGKCTATKTKSTSRIVDMKLQVQLQLQLYLVPARVRDLFRWHLELTQLASTHTDPSPLGKFAAPTIEQISERVEWSRKTAETARLYSRTCHHKNGQRIKGNFEILTADQLNAGEIRSGTEVSLKTGQVFHILCVGTVHVSLYTFLHMHLSSHAPLFPTSLFTCVFFSCSSACVSVCLCVYVCERCAR